jgi:hypothetical protein
MHAKPESACLVIADISGYTGYLAGAELDHAQDVLADLIDTVVTSLRPLLRLAKLEGDAAFCYLMTETVDASQLQDTVERCYFAFRRRLRDIDNASACECNACVLIPALDLKLLVHHGIVARQRIAGSEELVGSEVVLVHRLLKNTVEERLGLHAYGLYTDAVVDRMGVNDPEAIGFVRHLETYDVIGDVSCWVRDLAAAWQTELDRTRVYVDPKDALLTITTDLPGPPEVAWEWVNSPLRRPQWQAGVTEIRTDADGSRYGPGTTNHCMHGKDAIVEEILDWRPFDYVTDRSKMPQPGIPPFVTTMEFQPTATGTRVVYRLAKPRGLKDRAVLTAVAPMMRKAIVDGIGRLRPLIEADLAERAARSATEPVEPALRPSEGRHVREPVLGPIAYVDEAIDPGPVDSGVVGSSSG